MSSSIEKLHEPRVVDTSAAARGVWLVKVPNYLSESWKNASGSRDVGKLIISKPKMAGGKPDMVFSLSDELVARHAGPTPVPRNHKFVVTGIAAQSMAVMSETAAPGAIPNADGDVPLECVSVEGKVIQRAECRPMVDASYMKLKKLKMEQASKPQKEVKQIKNVVVNYKPVSVHANMRDDKKKNEEKRVRLDKDKVMDMLFSAFEKHQYYNVKDLVGITKQPVIYLKEVLKEICNYNMKAPHRNMWELKPEYRHYKDT